MVALHPRATTLPKTPLPDDERVLRDQLIKAIARTIRSRDLTQQQAALRMGIDQPTVSGLLRGKRRFTSDRLMHFLLLLGCDVQVSVRRATGRSRGVLRFGNDGQASTDASMRV